MPSHLPPPPLFVFFSPNSLSPPPPPPLYTPAFSSRKALVPSPSAQDRSGIPHEAKMAEWKTKISVPQQLLVPLSVPNVLLLGPGPANPSLRTYNASAMPLLGHLHPEFCKGNPKTRNPESGIRNPESGIKNPQIKENKFFKYAKISTAFACRK